MYLPVIFGSAGWFVFVALCLGASVLIWRGLLGEVRSEIGIRPLLLGFAAFLIATAALCVVASGLDARPSKAGAIELFVVFASVGVVAVTLVPLAAFLVGRRMFDIVAAPIGLGAVWLIASLLVWAVLPGGTLADRLGALLYAVAASALPILGLGGAFFVGIGLSLRWLPRRRPAN